VVAFAFAGVSLAWALGSTVGLDTLGGSIERMARAGEPALFVANTVALVLKALGGVLALALVQPWGRRLPRRPLLALGWLGAGVLVLYGGLQTTSIVLVATEVLVLEEPLSERALLWRMFLWEPWFLVWGLFLAGATLRCQRLSSQRTSRRSRSTRDGESYERTS
jgi:hypothetical protein